MPATPDREIQLVDFLDRETLRQLQDSFAAVTGVAIAFLDHRNRPIITPARPDVFCRLVWGSRSGCIACQKSGAHAAKRLGESDAPVRDVCHAGLTRYAAPIIVKGFRLGTIVIGNRPQGRMQIDGVRALAERHGIDSDTLASAAKALRSWSEQQMAAATGFAHLLADTLTRLCYQESELRHRIGELDTVYQAAGLLAATGDHQKVLEGIAERVCEVMNAKACSIRLLDQATGELTIKAVHNLSAAYLNKGPVTVGENPVDAKALSGEMVYIRDSRTDPRVRYPTQAATEGIVSAFVVGMMFRNEPVGVIRVYTDRVYDFSDYEQSLLRALASQAATAVTNARLYQEALTAERQQRQIQYAGEVQRRMIPAAPPEHAALEFGCAYVPVMEVGGDFYDFVRLGSGNLGVSIADVVGKGVPASLLMASLRAALRTYAEGIYDLDHVMVRVNRHMCRDMLASEFATVFYGVFSPDGHRLTYCNAGHNPPLLLRKGQFDSLNVGGMVVGVNAHATYDKGITHTEPGDVLVLYTDGLTEAINFHDEQFGIERLRESILRYQDLDANQLAQQLLWDVRRFKGLADRIDDITLVVVKVRN